jgi:hypothetical protein
MTDILQVALKRRLRLKSEIEKLDAFLRYADQLAKANLTDTRETPAAPPHAATDDLVLDRSTARQQPAARSSIFRGAAAVPDTAGNRHAV